MAGASLGQVGFARDVLPLRRLHGVEYAVLAREHGEGGERQFHRDPAGLQLHRAADRQRRGREQPVEGAVGGAFGIISDIDDQREGGGQKQRPAKEENALADRDGAFGTCPLAPIRAGEGRRHQPPSRSPVALGLPAGSPATRAT